MGRLGQRTTEALVGRLRVWTSPLHGARGRARAGTDNGKQTVERKYLPSLDSTGGFADAFGDVPAQVIVDSTSFASAVEIGRTNESRWLEFKGCLNLAKCHCTTSLKKKFSSGKCLSPVECGKKSKRELVRDVVQFANSDGGCLLFGVSEARNGGRIVASGLSSLLGENTSALVEKLQTAIRNYAVPKTFSYEIHEFDVEGRPVVAVNIQASAVPVWVQNGEAFELVVRGERGKKYLNPSESEMHIMNTARSLRIKFSTLAASLATPTVYLASGYYGGQRSSSNGPLHATHVSNEALLTSYNDNEFEIRLSGGLGNATNVSIPYELLRAVWTTSDGKLGIFLDVKVLAVRSGSISLVPH